jgi:hypothetical protein
MERPVLRRHFWRRQKKIEQQKSGRAVENLTLEALIGGCERAAGGGDLHFVRRPGRNNGAQDVITLNQTGR